jgi:uroporphyrinogen decarboxylase
MSANTMTPKERIGSFLGGKPIDRVPCVPLILNHAARVLGVSVSRFGSDGKVMADANAAAFRRYRQDLITVFTDTAIIAEAMGTKLAFPEDRAAYVAEPCVKTPEDAESLRAPDPLKDGRLPIYVEAAQRLNEMVGGEVFVACCYPAAFTTAACLRGTEMFARDLLRNPVLAHKLLKVSLDAALALTDAVCKAGAVPVPVDPVASGSVLSAKLFHEFVAPYMLPLFQRIQSYGWPAMYHVCGKTRLLLDELADLKPTALSLDKVDIVEAKKQIGDRVCLMGNIKPTETFFQGTPADVENEARLLIETVGDNPAGFILASGCEIPVDTPPENIHAMMRAAETYGRKS